jgi:hypothetical protein
LMKVLFDYCAGDSGLTKKVWLKTWKYTLSNFVGFSAFLRKINSSPVLIGKRFFFFFFFFYYLFILPNIVILQYIIIYQ